MSFKAALASYRKELTGAGVPPGSLVFRVLNRWSVHASVETVWKTLVSRLPADAMPTPSEFIYLVLQRRLMCERLREVVRDTPKLEAKSNSRTKRHLKTRNYAALALENQALDDLVKQGDRLFGREKTIGPRNKVFIRGWSDKFRELCGDPLDEVVRVLTEVAFGEAVTIAASAALGALPQGATVTLAPQNSGSVSHHHL